MALTFEHVLPLLVKYARPVLEILAPKEVGDGERLRGGRAGLDGLGSRRHLTRLTWLRRLAALLRVLLGLLLLHHLLLAHSLRLQLLDILRHSHAMLLSFSSQLALHEGNLLRRGLLSGAQRRRHRATGAGHRAWHWLSSLRARLALGGRRSHCWRRVSCREVDSIEKAVWEFRASVKLEGRSASTRPGPGGCTKR